MVEGVRSTPAHATKRHLPSLAHSPTWNAAGTRVYVVCGWQGCAQRLEVDAAVWQGEEGRREAAQREETPF